MRTITERLSALIRSPERRYELLSALCELGRLGDERLQGGCELLAQNEPDPLTSAVLCAAATRQGRRRREGGLRRPMSEALDLVKQLEALLLDMEVSLPLRVDLSGAERLRREVLIEAGRRWAARASEERDARALEILAEGSRRLGDLVLTSPEGWYSEGVGQLLGDLAELGGDVRLEVGRLSLVDVVEASAYPALLEALRRGVEGTEEVLRAPWWRARLEGRVRAEALETAAYVAARAAWSEERRAGGVAFEMVYCPPGEIWMGSKGGVGYVVGRPPYPVRLTRGFWMGRRRVTQALWERVMGSSSSLVTRAARSAVVVSWFDSVRFCNTLSELEGLEVAYQIGSGDTPAVTLNMLAAGYRLPTEAEWEYAAKAKGGLIEAERRIVQPRSSYDWSLSAHPPPEREERANAWGLYNMSEIVSEWCSDGRENQDNARAQGAREQGASDPPHSRHKDLSLRLCRSLER